MIVVQYKKINQLNSKNNQLKKAQ